MDNHLYLKEKKNKKEKVEGGVEALVHCPNMTPENAYTKDMEALVHTHLIDI